MPTRLLNSSNPGLRYVTPLYAYKSDFVRFRSIIGEARTEQTELYDSDEKALPRLRGSDRERSTW